VACGAFPPVPDSSLCGLSVRVYVCRELLAPLWIISLWWLPLFGTSPADDNTPALQSAYDTSVMLPSLSLLCLERLLLAGAAAWIVVCHGLLAQIDRARFPLALWCAIVGPCWQQTQQ
jgi:hypothetical protein